MCLCVRLFGRGEHKEKKAQHMFSIAKIDWLAVWDIPWISDSALIKNMLPGFQDRKRVILDEKMRSFIQIRRWVIFDRENRMHQNIPKVCRKRKTRGKPHFDTNTANE